MLPKLILVAFFYFNYLSPFTICMAIAAEVWPNSFSFETRPILLIRGAAPAHLDKGQSAPCLWHALVLACARANLQIE